MTTKEQILKNISHPICAYLFIWNILYFPFEEKEIIPFWIKNNNFILDI